MPDRAALGLLGFLFGGVTAIVMLVAATVVMATITEHYPPESSSSGIVPAIAATH